MANTVSTTGGSNPEVGIPDVPDSLTGRGKYMRDGLSHVKILAIRYRKGAVPEPRRLTGVAMFLNWLESCVEMTPALRKGGEIEKSLRIMLDPSMKFPEGDVQRAAALKDKWERENWGRGDFIADDVSEDEEENQTPTTATQPAPADQQGGTQTATIRPPPPSHPIFGKLGIMHGVIPSRGRRRNWRFNLQYKPRNAKVFGDNGLQVGDWWPFQIVALFNGAHGARVGGIAGSSQHGAYSIVMAGTYDSLDRDEGSTIYYSGSKSHENTDPHRPAPSSTYTKALKSNMSTEQPVRVLRSSSGKAHYAPPCGIRYDGLYRVAQMLTPKNDKGGMYEQFKLVRLPNQRPLDDIRRNSPTQQEKSDFEKIGELY